MANVIVSELANIVGTPVDRLLNQMKEAGLPQDHADAVVCLLYTSPSPRDVEESRMPSSA